MTIYDGNMCSPSVVKRGSCYNFESLKLIAKKINSYCSKNNINCNIIIQNDSNFHDLLSNIQNKMDEISPCKTEVCWLKSEILNELTHKERSLLQSGFKPMAPLSWEKNYNEWLSTLDIANVLKQYENQYKDFMLFGPTPIDFHLKNSDGSCKVDDLCAINLKNLIDSGITKVGIVFNTYPRYKGGQHWISMYIDLIDNNCLHGGEHHYKHKKHKATHNKYKAKHKAKQEKNKHKIKKIEKGILQSPNNINKKQNNDFISSGLYYFDSQGIKPPSNIINLMENICYQGNKCNIKFQKLYNDIQHQKKNTECGIYSIHFITSMLKGIKFKDYINNVNDDEEMEKFRKVFFIFQNEIQ